MADWFRKQGHTFNISGGGGGSAEIVKATYEETTALHNHSVGDLIVMMDNNTPTLYKVTDAITAGDTIALGTNITDNTGVSADMQVYVSGLPSSEEIKLVAWNTGTDAEITAMINGYYNGDLTLADIQSVWSVGDVRTVSLSAMSATGVGESHRAQDVQMQILDFDHDTLTTAINGKTKALVTVQQKDCLMDANCASGSEIGQNNTENGYVNSTSTNVGSWKECSRRTWCNSIYYNALPSSFKSLAKSVVKTTSIGNKSTSTETTDDKVFLLSEWEIYGSTIMATTQEGTQYGLYETAINRRKLPLWGASGSGSVTAQWWFRSPALSSENYYCYMASSTADSGYYYANYGLGIAPAMCL